MTTNITTLALNLLISERISHRTIFADRIIELLHQQPETEAAESNEYFLALIAACLENPNCDGRDFFYQMSQVYNLKINGVSGEVSIAA